MCRECVRELCLDVDRDEEEDAGDTRLRLLDMVLNVLVTERPSAGRQVLEALDEMHRRRHGTPLDDDHARVLLLFHNGAHSDSR